MKVVPPARFERAAPGLGILRSIQLSYGGKVEDTSGTSAGFIAEFSLNNKIGFTRIHKIFMTGKTCFSDNIFPISKLPQRTIFQVPVNKKGCLGKAAFFIAMN